MKMILGNIGWALISLLVALGTFHVTLWAYHHYGPPPTWVYMTLVVVVAIVTLAFGARIFLRSALGKRFLLWYFAKKMWLEFKLGPRLKSWGRTDRWKRYGKKAVVPFSWLWRGIRKGSSSIKEFSKKHWPSVQEKIRIWSAYVWGKIKTGLNYIWEALKKQFQEPGRGHELKNQIIAAAVVSGAIALIIYFTPWGSMRWLVKPTLWTVGTLLFITLLGILLWKSGSSGAAKTAKALAWVAGVLILVLGLVWLVGKAFDTSSVDAESLSSTCDVPAKRTEWITVTTDWSDAVFIPDGERARWTREDRTVAYAWRDSPTDEPVEIAGVPQKSLIDRKRARDGESVQFRVTDKLKKEVKMKINFYNYSDCQ